MTTTHLGRVTFGEQKGVHLAERQGPLPALTRLVLTPLLPPHRSSPPPPVASSRSPQTLHGSQPACNEVPTRPSQGRQPHREPLGRRCPPGIQRAEWA